MATATKESPDYTLTLVLSRKEAEVLRFVCACIGGDNRKSPRRYMDAIADALLDAGVDTADYALIAGAQSVHFKDGE